MNKKLLTIIVCVAVIIILGFIIYLFLPKNQPSDGGNNTNNIITTEIPSLPDKIDTASIPAEPVDLVLAEVTVTAQSENTLQITIDKIRDYIKYPKSTGEPLKAYENISIAFNGWIDTYKEKALVCPEGFTKKAISQAITEGSTQAVDKCDVHQIVTGESYLAKLSGCFFNSDIISCGKTGWSVYLYNPCQKVVKYECVQNTTIPPSVTPPPIIPSPK